MEPMRSVGPLSAARRSSGPCDFEKLRTCSVRWGRWRPRVAAGDCEISPEESSSTTMAPVCAMTAASSSARSGVSEWASLSQSRRAQVLFRFRDLLLDSREDMAALITQEHGKTLDDAAGEVLRAVDSIELATSGPALARGGTSLGTGPGIDTKSVLHPVGVCVGITPFNFPIMMGLMMMSVSLAAGNTFIWKPSEQAPSTSIRIAELLKVAGLPDGVLNVVHGQQDAVGALIDHPATPPPRSVLPASAAWRSPWPSSSVPTKSPCSPGSANAHGIPISMPERLRERSSGRS